MFAGRREDSESERVSMKEEKQRRKNTKREREKEMIEVTEVRRRETKVVRKFG